MPRFNRASNRRTTGGESPASGDSFDNMTFDDDLNDSDKAALGELLGGGLPSGNDSAFDDDMLLFDDSLPSADQPEPSAREENTDLRKSFGVLFKAISDRIKGKKAQPSTDRQELTDGFDDGWADDRGDGFPDHFSDDGGNGEFPDSFPNGEAYGGYPDSASNGEAYGGYPNGVSNGEAYGGYHDGASNGEAYGGYPDGFPNGEAYDGFPASSDTWDDDLSESPPFRDGFDETLTDPASAAVDSGAKGHSIGARLSVFAASVREKLTHMIKGKPANDDSVLSDDQGEFSDFIEWEGQGQEDRSPLAEAAQSPDAPFPFAADRAENPPFEGEYGMLGNEAAQLPEGESRWGREPQDFSDMPSPPPEDSPGENASAAPLPAAGKNLSPIGSVIAALGRSWRQFRKRLPSFKPKVYTVPVPDYQPEEDGIQAPSLVSDIEKIIRKQNELGEVEREYEEMRTYIRSVDVDAAPRREDIPPPENMHEVREAEHELFDLIRQIDVQNEQQRSRIGFYDAPPEEDPYNYRGINDNRQTYDDIEDASFDMRPRLSFESEQRIDPQRQWNERQAFGSPFDIRDDLPPGMPPAQDGRTGRFAPRTGNAQGNNAPGMPSAQDGRTGRFAPGTGSAQGNNAPGMPPAQDGRTGRFAPGTGNAQGNNAPGMPSAPVRENAPREKRRAKVRKRGNMADW